MTDYDRIREIGQLRAQNEHLGAKMEALNLECGEYAETVEKLQAENKRLRLMVRDVADAILKVVSDGPEALERKA